MYPCSIFFSVKEPHTNAFAKSSQNMFFRIPKNVAFREKSISELLSLYFPAYIADLLLQSYNLFPQYFLFGISFFIRKITHLNRDISSLTQFGDHSTSLSFIKTLQEVEFNFVAADQKYEFSSYTHPLKILHISSISL